jgi:hypothetical protein
MAISDMSPSDDPFPITPSDALPPAQAVRGISIATAGNLKVTTVKGNQVILAMPAGGPFPMRVTQVWAGGTTAAGLVGYP